MIHDPKAAKVATVVHQLDQLPTRHAWAELNRYPEALHRRS